MKTFPPRYFTFATRYPESGTRMQLGRSYTYTVAAEGPDQRIFELKISGMTYFLDGNDDPDREREPERNNWVLEDFYLEHRLSKSFLLQHPTYGEVTCKFNRPIEFPHGMKGGNGLLPEFDVELLEIP